MAKISLTLPSRRLYFWGWRGCSTSVLPAKMQAICPALWLDAMPPPC